MNLVLTSEYLPVCAANLDTWRLKKQFVILMQLVYTIALEKEAMYNISLYGNLSEIKLDRQYTNHPLHTWALQSPFHILLICSYANMCVFELISRRIRIPEEYRALIEIARETEGWLYSIIPFRNKEALTVTYLSEKQLYRATDFEDEPNIYKAYQKHLIKRWKSDIEKLVEYESLMLKYKATPELPKPRKPRGLGWGWPVKEFPAFAHEELLEYRERLVNAKN